MKIGYARVSSTEQNLDRQLDALQKEGCEKIYKETISSFASKRKKYDLCLKNLKEGDVLVILDLDRMFRSTKQFMIFWDEYIVGKKIEFKCINSPIDTTNIHGKLVASIMVSVAEFERNFSKQRAREGVEAAKARGESGGRPRIPDRVRNKVRELEGQYTIKKIASMFGISTWSVRAMFREVA
jgi:DNA invertase Pin-like site-specific DNA recombinase